MVDYSHDINANNGHVVQGLLLNTSPFALSMKKNGILILLQYFTAVGVQIGAATLEVLKRAKIKCTIWSSCTTPWHISKGLDILLHRYLLSNVHCP